METLEKVKAKLQKYPHVRYESDDSSISIFPTLENGFTVRITIAGNSYTVFYNGWHERFTNENDALDCLAFGLSSNCRLKEFHRGNWAHKWTVESLDNNQWIEDSTVGLIFFPFWLSKNERYLQNDLIQSIDR